MSPLRLNGSTSGAVTLDCPAVGGNNTLVLPTGNGSANQALVTDGSGSLSWSDRGRMTLGTAQNSTSGTAIDFTGIPSWVKRVTVMFSGMSTNGTSTIQVQLGTSAGVVTTGYNSGNLTTLSSAIASQQVTTGVPIGGSIAGTSTIFGQLIISNLTGNTWVAFGNTCRGNDARIECMAGQIALSGTLDRVRITTVNGTDTFDAGSINILYEG